MSGDTYNGASELMLFWPISTPAPPPNDDDEDESENQRAPAARWRNVRRYIEAFFDFVIGPRNSRWLD